jgi:Fur family ferric uptake transcriptional regulator
MNTDAAREILHEYLKSKGNLRTTPERYAVLDAVLQTQGHFDAETLYYRLITGGTKISKATVYNTLDLLQDWFAEKTSRYEKAFGRPHHHHMICLGCGDILEFVSEKLERIQVEVCGEKQFDAQSSTLQIFGLCAKCQKPE